MDKRILPILMALCLLCTGCASLLERSYSSVEPYTDRFWDSTAEDTLKAESYQDLVNSLLMLIEQRSEEGIIRYYGSEDENALVEQIQELVNYAVEQAATGETPPLADENGEYPADMTTLGTLVQDICYHNAKRYFNL